MERHLWTKNPQLLMWIFCPQMTLHDIPGLWVFVHNLQIGVNNLQCRLYTLNNVLVLKFNRRYMQSKMFAIELLAQMMLR